MINDIEIQKPIKRRPKRTFSIKDKQKFYAQWKRSGLTMNKFCNEKDLIRSSFSNWVKKISSEQTVKNNDNWIPVVTKEKLKPSKIHNLPIPVNLNITTQILIALLLIFIVLDYAAKFIR